MMSYATKIFSECSHENIDFPANLSNLTVVKHYRGGSGGVYEVQDSQTGKRYILKLATNDEHVKQEALADTLYLRLGMKVPSLSVYQGTLPEALVQGIQKTSGLDVSERQYCRLSEKIEGTEPNPADLPIIQQALAPYFVLLAFCRNLDIAKFDNLMKTASGDVYCIDNGSFLATRAIGEETIANIDAIKELYSFRDARFSSLGQQFFGSLTDDEIQKQIQGLIEQQSTLINTALELKDTLSIQGFQDMYDLLTQRFESLVRDDHALFSRADLDSHVTASGIFSITHIGTEPYVLLGCRNGLDADHWCSLGGTRDENESAQEAAIREVLEESNGMVRYSPGALTYRPYVDLPITQGTYRLYFSPTKHCQTKQMNEHLTVAGAHERREYQSFAWVHLGDLMKGIQEQQKEIPVRIFNDDKSASLQTIKIYPDMRKALERPNSALFIIKMSQGYWLPPTKARLKEELAQTMVKRAPVIHELKEKFKKDTTPSMDEPAQPTHDTIGRSLSDVHLNALLGSDGAMEPLEKQVSEFLKQSLVSSSKVATDPFYQAQICQAIKEERRYQAQGYMTLYHAVPREVAILYDLYTTIHHWISLNPDESRLRYPESIFNKIENIQTFMKHFDPTGKGHINNYERDYQALGLSCNVAIFGSPMRVGSASYALWADNSSAREIYIFSKNGILANGLREMGLDEPLIELLVARCQQLCQRTQKQAGGELYQIHVPNTIVDDYAYPAIPGGSRYSEDSLSTILNEFRRTKDKKVRDDLQARFLPHPNVMALAKVFTYSAQEISQDEQKLYRHALDENAQLVVEQALILGTTSSMALKEPPTQRIYAEQIKRLSGEEPVVDPFKLLARLVKAQQARKIHLCLTQYESTLSDPTKREELVSLLATTPESVVILSNHPGLKHSEFLRQLLQETALKCIKTAKDMEIILQQLSREQQPIIFEILKNRISILIKNHNDLLDILKHISYGQHTVVYDVIKNRIPELIKTANSHDVKMILSYFTIDQRYAVFETIKHHIPKLINTSTDLENIISYFSHRQHTTILDAIKDKIQDLIKTPADMMRLFGLLSHKKRKFVFYAIKDKIPHLIQTPIDMEMGCLFLSLAQRKFVFHASKDQTPELINNLDVLEAMFRNLSPSKGFAFYELIKSHVLNLLMTQDKKHQDDNVVKIMKHISQEQQTELKELLAFVNIIQPPYQKEAEQLVLALINNDHAKMVTHFEALTKKPSSSSTFFSHPLPALDGLFKLNQGLLERLSAALGVELDEVRKLCGAPGESASSFGVTDKPLPK